MEVRELKSRGRSLLARFLIFSLLLGSLFYGETNPVEAAEYTLVISYDEAGEAIQRCTGNETSVTFTPLSAKDAGLQLKEGQHMAGWNLGDDAGTLIAPGEKVTLYWEELSAYFEESTEWPVSVSPVIVNYSFPTIYTDNTGIEREITFDGEITTSVGKTEPVEEGEFPFYYYTVSVTGTPTADHHQFSNWSVAGGDMPMAVNPKGEIVSAEMTDDGSMVAGEEAYQF